MTRRKQCSTPGCRRERFDDWIYCIYCGDEILDSIEAKYDGIDLEHHEGPPLTSGITPMYDYLRTKKDKNDEADAP